MSETKPEEKPKIKSDTYNLWAEYVKKEYGDAIPAREIAEHATREAMARQVGATQHYKKMGIQPWEAMEAWLSPDEFRGFLVGNSIKYLARAGKKGDYKEDIQKAHHYLEKLLEML